MFSLKRGLSRCYRRAGRVRALAAGVLAACLVGLAVAGPALAKEPARPELSLNQAVALALSNSDSVKKAAREVDRTEEWRNYRADQLNYTPTSPPGSALVEVPWSQLLAADLQWRMSKKQLTAEQDAVALDTCKKYFDILAAQEKVSQAQAAVTSARQQLQNAQAGYNAGVAIKADLTAAEAQYQAAQASLKSAGNDLDKAYTAFNKLVGLWPEDRPVLTDKVEFKPLEITSLDYEVEKALESCPAVWLAQQKATLQKYLEDMMFYTGEYRPYQARKIETEQAELDAADTKKAFEQVTRSLYFGVKNLEEAYAAAQEGLLTAQDNLKLARAKYQAGVATRAEVSAAQKAVADASYNCFNLACQHAYMKLAFEKPWAYLSSAGAGGAGSGSQ